MNPRVRHVLVSAAVILVVILLAGATYQGVATALERRKYPHPGQLLDVGGHQLHIHCTGEGSPTVVLEAAATGMSAAWGLVQPEVAKATRVCSYDRSGLGWSEAGDRPFDPGRVPEELHALLRAANETPPYIMAGHSLGASFARMYAARYPADVGGLVVIDPASGNAPADLRLLPLAPWLARAGVLRATGILSNDANGLPEPAAGAVSSFLNRPDHLTRASRELARWNDAVRLGEEAAVPDTIPVATVETVQPSAFDDAYFVTRSPFLNDASTARRITAAIQAVVQKPANKKARTKVRASE